MIINDQNFEDLIEIIENPIQYTNKSINITVKKQLNNNQIPLVNNALSIDLLTINLYLEGWSKNYGDFTFLKRLKNLKGLSIQLYDFFNLDYIKHLQLDRLRISMFSNTKIDLNYILDTLKSINTLIISNKCRNIEKISELTYLKNLAITNNNFSLEWLFLLDCLEKVSIGYSKMIEMQNSVEHAPALRYLNIFNVDNITHLPIVQDLKKLEFLDINSLPRLLEIPSFEKCENLKRIAIENLPSVYDFNNLLSPPYIEELAIYSAINNIGFIKKIHTSKSIKSVFFEDGFAINLHINKQFPWIKTSDFISDKMKALLAWDII
ncbi:MAG: hypothetical protein H6574_20745 [Lewinellaceae bacterium]|nr:hypothetical protein [Lewinellaceae bacterium]